MRRNLEVRAGPPYPRPMITELRTRPTVHEAVTRTEYGPYDAMAPRVVEYQPGNGTRYVMVLTDLPEGSERITGHPSGTVLVHVQNYGRCVTVEPGVELDPGKVRRSLDCSAADAMVLAEAIGHLAGVPHRSCGPASVPAVVPSAPEVDDHIGAGIDY